MPVVDRRSAGPARGDGGRAAHPAVVTGSILRSTTGAAVRLRPRTCPLSHLHRWGRVASALPIADTWSSRAGRRHRRARGHDRVPRRPPTLGDRRRSCRPDARQRGGLAALQCPLGSCGRVRPGCRRAEAFAPKDALAGPVLRGAQVGPVRGRGTATRRGPPGQRAVVQRPRCRSVAGHPRQTADRGPSAGCAGAAGRGWAVIWLDLPGRELEVPRPLTSRTHHVSRKGDTRE